VGSRRNNAPSLPLACAPAEAAVSAESARLERSRLIDEHDGDVIAHSVPQLALVADERLLCFEVFELTFAFRTDKYFEKAG
jgi:hypothetical protein